MNFRLIKKASKHYYFQSFSTILKVSALKTVTSESGVKNPIQQSTFHLQRSSGARAMLGFVPQGRGQPSGGDGREEKNLLTWNEGTLSIFNVFDEKI